VRMVALDLSTVSSGLKCIARNSNTPYPYVEANVTLPLTLSPGHDITLPSMILSPSPHTAFLVGQLKRAKALGVASLRQIAAVRYEDWKKTCGDKKDFVSCLFKVIDHDLMVLFNHPLTFHDVVVFVAQAQHYFLDIMAFLDYILYVLPQVDNPPFVPPPVRSGWMGCFTTDTRVCDELFHSGVPEWLIRPNFTITPRTIIETPVRYTFPDHIIRSMYSEGSKPSCSFEVLYCGPGGYRRHLHTCCHYIATVESSTPGSQPSSSQAASNVGRAPT
jgi:hypothetical protein